MKRRRTNARTRVIGVLENERAEVHAPDLPNGVIDSPELFLLAVKIGTGGLEYREGALEYLHNKVREDLGRIGALGTHINVMAYWTGAYLGLRVANRGYKVRLEQMAQQQKEEHKVRIYH